MTMFNRFCSLGWNCEPGLVLRRLKFPERLDYFKWSATQFEPMIAIIEDDFTNAYKAENLEIVDIMVRDKLYGVATHMPSKKYFSIGEEGRTNSDLFAYIEKDKKQRSDLFLQELRSPEPIAYINAFLGENGRAAALRLRKVLLEKGGNPKSRVIFVQEASVKEAPWGEDGIDNHYVDAFAPYNDAESFKVEQWDRILKNYDVVDIPKTEAHG